MGVDGILDLYWGKRVEQLQNPKINKPIFLKILHLLSFLIYNLNIYITILVDQFSFAVGLVLKPGRLLIDYSLINCLVTN